MSNQSTVLGNTVDVGFASFGSTSTTGKVDTGATTSSLHATQVKVDQQRGSVSFHSDILSNNVVTLPLKSVQEVHSADAGGVTRPTVSLDITIDGNPLSGVMFNLNDRSNMDTKILIGQNVLQAGHFIIDPNKDSTPSDQPKLAAPTAESSILQAIEVLVENDVSLGDIMKYLQTAAINRITE